LQASLQGETVIFKEYKIERGKITTVEKKYIYALALEYQGMCSIYPHVTGQHYSLTVIATKLSLQAGKTDHTSIYEVNHNTVESA
jgi:hypothetical protein